MLRISPAAGPLRAAVVSPGAALQPGEASGTLVRATGGLKDSVQDFDYQNSRNGNGFVFENYNSGALLATIDRALAVFRKKPHWSRLMKNAMACDHSWDRSAAAYINLYRKLLLR